MSEEGFEEFEASLRERFGTTEETTPDETPQAAEPEPASAAQEEAPSEEGRPRDEQGRFLPKDEPILGKFKSQEELERAYQELERRHGEQGNEIGELRQIREQWEQFQADQNRSRQLHGFDDLLEEDPAEATERAYQAEDAAALQRAAAVWQQTDPAGFRAWARAAAAERQVLQMRQEIEQRYAPIEQDHSQQRVTRAWTSFAKRTPDAEQFADAIFEAAQSSPEIVAGLQQGSQEAAERVFENLYAIAAYNRQRQAGTLNAAAQQVAAQQAEETRAAKTSAAVASASTNPASREDKGAIDRFKEAILGTPLGLVDQFEDQ